METDILLANQLSLVPWRNFRPTELIGQNSDPSWFYIHMCAHWILEWQIFMYILIANVIYGFFTNWTKTLCNLFKSMHWHMRIPRVEKKIMRSTEFNPIRKCAKFRYELTYDGKWKHDGSLAMNAHQISLLHERELTIRH